MGSLRSLKTQSYQDNPKRLLRKDWQAFEYPLSEEEELEVALSVCKKCGMGIHCPTVGSGGWCDDQISEIEYISEIVGTSWGP